MQTLEEISKGDREQKVEHDRVFDQSSYRAAVVDWLNHPISVEFFDGLREAEESLIQRAKDLASADETQSASIIRAALIESKTIEKVIKYGRRTNADRKY